MKMNLSKPVNVLLFFFTIGTLSAQEIITDRPNQTES